MDEHELEQRLRDGLERRAAETDVSAPVVDRARAQASQRRRTRWSVVGAAAAVALVVGGVAVVTSRGGDDAKPQLPVADDSPTPDAQPPAPGDWRTEYWGGVAVDVPTDWAYGGAPIAHDGGGVSDVSACYPEAMVGADGRRLRQSGDRGWVGRPIAVTDICTPYPWIEHSPQEEPAAPYVWLGAAVEPGVVEYGNGVVEETVEVAGVAITVASDDAALREEILGSARVIDDAVCSSSLPNLPPSKAGFLAGGSAADAYAWVCAYHRFDEGRFVLSYAAEIDLTSAEQALRAQTEAPDQRVDCDYEPFEFVVLATGVPGHPVAHVVYETGCAGGTVDLGGGIVKEMVAAGVEPWAHNGIPAVVYGPTGGKGAMIDSFIGQLG